MSINLNNNIDMSTYLNEEGCKKILGKCIASSVKKLNELVDIENLKKNGKRQSYNQDKKKMLIEELHALNNIVESINAYLDLICK